MRFLPLILLVALLALPGCVTGVLDDTGMGLRVEPLVSLGRLRQSETAAKEYSDSLAEAVQSVATKVQDEQAKTLAAVATAKRQSEQQAFDVSDVLQSEWFYALIAALGLGEIGRRKYRKAKAQLPDDYEEVEPTSTEAV